MWHSLYMGPCAQAWIPQKWICLKLTWHLYFFLHDTFHISSSSPGLTVIADCNQTLRHCFFSLSQRIWRILYYDEDVLAVRGDQDFVLLALDPEVGELVGRIQVPDDRLGAFRQRGHQYRVLRGKARGMLLLANSRLTLCANPVSAQFEVIGTTKIVPSLKNDLPCSLFEFFIGKTVSNNFLPPYREKVQN